mgnify:CR=1 FL=1
MRRLILILCSLVFASAAHAKAVKIAFVDMQRALLQVDEGKSAKKTLEKMKAERQAELDKLQDELRKLKVNFDSQKEFMPPPKRAEKEEEFRGKLMELQRKYAELQKELATEEAKLSKTIFARMARILQGIGEKQEYTMIFEKTESSLLWAERHLDLTDEVIRRYNAGEGKAKAKGSDKKDTKDKKKDKKDK